jgi:hypothetical protein
LLGSVSILALAAAIMVARIMDMATATIRMRIPITVTVTTPATHTDTDLIGEAPGDGIGGAGISVGETRQRIARYAKGGVYLSEGLGLAGSRATGDLVLTNLTREVNRVLAARATKLPSSRRLVFYS